MNEIKKQKAVKADADLLEELEQRIVMLEEAPGGPVAEHMPGLCDSCRHLRMPDLAPAFTASAPYLLVRARHAVVVARRPLTMLFQLAGMS